MEEDDLDHINVDIDDASDAFAYVDTDTGVVGKMGYLTKYFGHFSTPYNTVAWPSNGEHRATVNVTLKVSKTICANLWTFDLICGSQGHVLGLHKE